MKKLSSKNQIEFLENANALEYAFAAGLTSTPVSPEFYEFMRPFQWLHNTAMVYRGFGGKHVMYRNVKGQLKHVSWYEFIIKGLPYIQKGLKEILNIVNDEVRTAEMIRFEAIVRIICSGKIASKYYNLTENMISEQIRVTELLEPAYNESRWITELKSVFGYTAIGAGTNDYSKVLGGIAS